MQRKIPIMLSYSTPNKEALKFLDEEVVSDERFYPDEALTEKLEVYAATLVKKC